MTNNLVHIDKIDENLNDPTIFSAMCLIADSISGLIIECAHYLLLFFYSS